MTISDSEERNIVADMLMGFGWIGLSDIQVEGVFQWVNGEPLNLTYWSPGQPDNFSGIEDYVYDNGNGNWNDLDPGNSLQYVMEVEGVQNIKSGGLYSGDMFPIGTTTVEYFAVDGAGNQSGTCAFTVTVGDVEKPEISCPGNIVVSNDQYHCGASVNFAATATDNCPESGNLIFYYSISPGSAFPVGTTTVSATVKDAALNESVPCSFEVTVNDTQTPSVFCSNDISVANDPGRCDAVVGFFATGSDNCYSGNLSIPGTNYLTTIGDNQYFLSTAKFTWEAAKADAEAKGGHLATINSAAESTALSGLSISGWIGLTDKYAEGAYRWVTGETFGFTNWLPGEPKNLGNEDYVILLPGGWNDLPNTGGSGSGGGEYYILEIDNGVRVFQTAGLAPLSQFQVGMHQISYQAVDAAGNTSGTCSFSITVSDTEAPVINNCPNGTTIEMDNLPGFCGANVIFTTYPNGITADDNCGIQNVLRSPELLTNFSGGYFNVGSTVMTFTANDIHGNSTECSFTVVVNDVEDPTITCPANRVLCGAQTFSWANTVGDNCGVATLTCSPPSGSLFGVGMTMVTCAVEDVNGNLNSCSFTVTIHQLPNVSITTNLIPFGCQGLGILNAKVLNANNLIPPFSYSWSNDLGYDPSVIIAANGTYGVTVEDASGCSNTTAITTNINRYTTLSNYTMLSIKEVDLKESTVNGGIGIADSNKKAKIKNNSAVNGFVQAADIDLNSSTINGGNTYPYPNNPPYGAAIVVLPTFQFNTLSNNSSPGLTVNNGQTVTISSPNNVYDKIEVKDGATLIFDGSIGTLYAKEIKTKDGASIVFGGNTEVRVQKKVDIDKNNTVGPNGPYTVNFWIEDDLSVKEGSNFTGNVYAMKKIESKGKSNSSNSMTGIFISENKVDSDHATWNRNPNCGLNLDGSQNLLALGDDLLGFNAMPDEHLVKLLWVTNTEYKNDRFVVERSVDGVDFEPMFEVQHKYAGAKPKQYRDVDIHPNVGSNFYRIKVLFEDGTFMYSEIKQADFQMDLDNFNLWPNPASESITVFSEKFAGKAAQIQIVNNLGQPLFEQKFDVLPDSPVTFELNDFRDGMYHFLIRVEGHRMRTRTFVIAR